MNPSCRRKLFLLLWLRVKRLEWGGDKTPDWWEQIFLNCQHSRAVVAKQAGKSLHANFMARDPLVSVYCLTATRLSVRFPPHRSVRSLQVLPAWVLSRCTGSFVLYANPWPRGKIAARPGCNPPSPSNSRKWPQRTTSLSIKKTQ